MDRVYRRVMGVPPDSPFSAYIWETNGFGQVVYVSQSNASVDTFWKKKTEIRDALLEMALQIKRSEGFELYLHGLVYRNNRTVRWDEDYNDEEKTSTKGLTEQLKEMVSQALAHLTSVYLSSVQVTRVELFDVNSAVGALMEVRSLANVFPWVDYKNVFQQMHETVFDTGVKLILSDRFTFLTLGDPDVYRCILDRYSH
ncbi:unnamed protein product [Echinostoma caproni]|uniref:HORMA domain-containing protein n=1 Tax=Echinostoma caproni TaxID=27848 RepID=A0A183AZP1_9TREM|nr:unnamed protein product [Echinostoma caproni]